MSDTTDAILKIISSITSTKGAVNFLSISATLVLLWNYSSNYLDKVGLPNEHKQLALLFAAIGIGTLVGRVVNYTGTFLYKLTWMKHLSSEQLKQAEIEKEKRYQNTLSHFKEMYKHYSFSAKEILWELSIDSDDGSKVLYDDHEEADTIEHLVSNGFIKIKSRINGQEGIYKIHPYISSHLRDIYEKEISSTVNKFLNENNTHPLLLETITSDNYTPKGSYRLLVDIFYVAYPIIQTNIQDVSDDNWNSIRKTLSIHVHPRFNNEISMQLKKTLFKREFDIQKDETLINFVSELEDNTKPNI